MAHCDQQQRGATNPPPVIAYPPPKPMQCPCPVPTPVGYPTADDSSTQAQQVRLETKSRGNEGFLKGCLAALCCCCCLDACCF